MFYSVGGVLVHCVTWCACCVVCLCVLKRNDMAGLRSKKNLTSFIRRSKMRSFTLATRAN